MLKILKENLNIMKNETVKTMVNVVKNEANLSQSQTRGDLRRHDEDPVQRGPGLDPGIEKGQCGENVKSEPCLWFTGMCPCEGL